jgi:UDP-glucose 4-epimerase
MPEQQPSPGEMQSYYSNKRVLVTAGSSPTAAALVAGLGALGAQITAIDDPLKPESAGFNPNQGIQVIRAGLENWLETAPGRLDHFDLVFHLQGNGSTAASLENPAEDLRRNLLNTFALLEALRKSPSQARMVNISSGAVYGNPLRLPIRETDPTVPVSPLGVSLLAAERYVDVYNLHYKIPAINLRLFEVYGPVIMSGFVYDILSAIEKYPGLISLPGDGQQLTDQLFITDAVQAILLAGWKAPARGEVYNVASGSSIPKADLAQIVFNTLSVEPGMNFSGKRFAGDIRDIVVDVHRIWSLGFSPRFSLEQGIAETSRLFSG